VADCLFCRVLSGELPSKIVHQDERCVAIEDKFPQAPVHLLVMPRRHFESLNEASDADRDLLGHLLLVARRVAESKGVSSSGYRVLTNVGADGGQSVPHLHFHVLGGKKLGPKLVG